MTENRLPPSEPSAEAAASEPRPFPSTLDQLAWMLLPAFTSDLYARAIKNVEEAAKRGQASGLAVPNGAGNVLVVQFDLAHVPWTNSGLEELAMQLAYRTAARMLRYGATTAAASAMPGLAPVPPL